MKELIEKAGKKCYTIVMGRPNPAKLANFPEVIEVSALIMFLFLHCSSRWITSMIFPFLCSVMFLCMSLVPKPLFWIAKNFLLQSSPLLKLY